MKEKYETYLEQQYVDAAIAEGDLKGRLKAAKAVVIQQDYYPGFRTNRNRFEEILWKNEENLKNLWLLLEITELQRGGHWDFRMAQTNDDGSYQNSTQNRFLAPAFLAALLRWLNFE